LDLRDIEYFGVIAEHKHLGRAAQALGLSVPAVSKSLRRLEAATEAKLVRRTPKGVELTTEGTALLSHVRDLRVSVRDITRQLADLRQGRVGDIRVGAAPGHAEYLLPPACSALYASGAGVTVSVLVGSKDVTLPALLQGELDLVITDPAIAADDGLLHEPLYDDNVLVTSARDHPLAARGKLTLADLVGERWATSNSRTHGQLCEIFRKCGLPLPQVALLSNSSWLRLRTVAMSRLLGTFAVPANFAFAEAYSQLKLLPVEDLVWKRSFCVAYRSSAYLSPAVRRLIDELRTVARARRDVPAGIAAETMI
jgi:DNA-binding transcriptional LysR family regulator